MLEISTNVRTNIAPRVPGYPGTAVSWLSQISKLSPILAAWVGSHWFTQPRRRARPEREQRLLTSATAFSLQGGQQAWSFGQGPLVVLVHGWEGRGAQLGEFVEPLVASGFRVVTFDVAAHGSSHGTHATILSWLSPLSEIAMRFGDPVCAIGHSFGCPALSLALKRGYHAQSVVYLAPPDALDGGTRNFARLTGIGERGKAALENLLSARTGISFAEERVENFGATMNTPLLVVHDEDDTDVPLECAQTYARNWPGCHVFTTRGLGHHKLLRDTTVIERVTTFVRGQHTSANALDRWFDSAYHDRTPFVANPESAPSAQPKLA